MSDERQDDLQEHQETPWVDADHSGETDDPWHAHTPDEGVPQPSHGETSPATIAAVGIISFALLGVTMAFVAFYFIQINQIEYTRKVEIDIGQDVRSLQRVWEADLRNYGWVDAPNNVVHIPIDRAIRSVAREYAQER
ncbi:MAG: hypothetical protein EA376_12485 [Phycisphaeraceae bacterium]|nr:MAG: hypothetical protein EA376_12485 [Phycisphaeraceae bacterium]